MIRSTASFSLRKGLKSIMQTSVETTLTKLSHQVRWLSVLCLVQALGFVVLMMDGRLVKAQSTPATMRVRGLIVEDDQGRPRIVMGAPFPNVAERSRKDPPTNAMVFLDESGHD